MSDKGNSARNKNVSIDNVKGQTNTGWNGMADQAKSIILVTVRFKQYYLLKMKN